MRYSPVWHDCLGCELYVRPMFGVRLGFWVKFHKLLI